MLNCGKLSFVKTAVLKYLLAITSRSLKMEIFKSEEMKKEYKEYLGLLDDVLECGFCRKLSCKYD